MPVRTKREPTTAPNITPDRATVEQHVRILREIKAPQTLIDLAERVA